MPSSALIHFICQFKHPELLNARVARFDRLSVHDGEWAYCFRDGQTGHQWQPIPPVSMAVIKLREVADEMSD